MNIAVFSRSTIDHLTSGGMETQLQNLVEGLVQSGHSVTVITTSHPYRSEPYIEIEDLELNRNGVDYFFIGDTTPGLAPLNSWERVFSMLKLLKRGVKKEGAKNYYKESLRVFSNLDKENKFDCVISQSTIGYGVIDSLDIPIISVIHGSIKAEIKNRFKTNRTLFNWGRYLGVDLPKWILEMYTVNRKFFSRVDKVIAVSKAVKNEFIGDHPKFGHKVEIIYNGVDAELFKPNFEKRETFQVLYVGRMVREKGIDLTIKAVKNLVDKGLEITFNLVGTGEHLSELRGLAVNLGLSNYVNFVGDVPNETLPEYYQSASIFALPTRRVEGHPMTVSEAYCSGLPVIATVKGGLKELVYNHETGFIVKDDDVLDLTKKIKHMYENKKVVDRISNNVRKIGVAKYSKKAMTKKYNEVLKNLVEDNPGLDNNR